MPIYRSYNKKGELCSATAFVGYYKDVCRLWTRRHCLADGDGKEAAMERARKAEYWFLYRKKEQEGRKVVQGEKLIFDEPVRWEKVYHILCTL